MKMTSELLQRIRNNDPTLGHLGFQIEGKIGDKGVRELAEALKVNTVATYVDLCCNEIGDVGVRELASLLKVNRTLTTLYLHSNQIRDEGARELAEALKVNSTLTVLWLMYNQIGDVGAQEIAEALKRNSTLTEIKLNNNKIGVAGAMGLAGAIKVNSTLTAIDLSDNQIDDTGAQEIAEALKCNSTLTKINLGNNKIGNAGAMGLASVLSVNSTLTDIGLPDNQIDDGGIRSLAEALKRNSTLTSIDLKYNNTSPHNGPGALVDMLRINTTLTYIGFNEIYYDSESVDGQKGAFGTQVSKSIREGISRNQANKAKLEKTTKSKAETTPVTKPSVPVKVSPTTASPQQPVASSQVMADGKRGNEGGANPETKKQKVTLFSPIQLPGSLFSVVPKPPINIEAKTPREDGKKCFRVTVNYLTLKREVSEGLQGMLQGYAASGLCLSPPPGVKATIIGSNDYSYIKQLDYADLESAQEVAEQLQAALTSLNQFFGTNSAVSQSDNNTVFRQNR